MEEDQSQEVGLEDETEPVLCPQIEVFSQNGGKASFLEVLIAVLFCAQSISITFLFQTTNELEKTKLDTLIANSAVIVFYLSILFGFLSAAMLLSKRFVETGINIAQPFSICMLSVFALSCFLFGGDGSWVVGAAAVCIILADLVWRVRVANNLQFVCLHVKTIAKTLRNCHFLFLLVAVVALLQAFYLWYWMLAAIQCIHFDFDILRVTYLFLSLLWTCQVCVLFVGGLSIAVTTNSLLGGPLSQSAVLCRALSITLGKQFSSLSRLGLFSGLTDLLWLALRFFWRRRPHGWVTARLEKALERSHKYCLPDIVLRRLTAAEALVDSWSLYKGQGVSAAIVQDYTGRVALFLENGYAAACASMVAVLLLAQSSLEWLAVSLVIFAVAFCQVQLWLRPFTAGMMAFYYVFSRHPEQLSKKAPLVYHRLVRMSEIGSLQQVEVLYEKKSLLTSSRRK